MENENPQALAFAQRQLKKKSALLGLGFGISGVFIFTVLIWINLWWLDYPYVEDSANNNPSFESYYTFQIILATVIGYVSLLIASPWAAMMTAQRVLKGKDVFISSSVYTYIALFACFFLAIVALFADELEDFLDPEALIFLLPAAGIAFCFAFVPTALFGPLLGFCIEDLAKSMGFEVRKEPQ